jgi:hypothetical protein
VTPETAQALLDNVFEKYVRPELQRRATADAGLSEQVWAAQVIFGDGPPVIRLNTEVRLQARIDVAGGWQDFAELRRNGPVMVSEVSLLPEEAGIKHITICQIGADGEWKLLFDARGNEKLVDDEPGLGAVFQSHDAGAPPLEKLRARTEQLYIAVSNCLEQDFIESAMILLYAGIDAMAWLNLPPNVNDVEGADFKRWVADYFLPGSRFNCSPEDMYGARCGLVHTNTSESKLNRKGRATKIFYYRERDGVKQGILQILMDEQHMPWFIDIDQLIINFRTAIERFIDDISTDTNRLDLVYERIQRSYFSRGVFLGRPSN